MIQISRAFTGAWLILIGVLLLTPAKIFCIACEIVPEARGYIGKPGVTIVAIVSIVAGLVGLVTSGMSDGPRTRF